ncbi:YopX family protein [Streptococcus orisratti]|uniref:YopX family protein n=1 Tax=Streptococcus orisratti TaxID=114652 RepID=UPI0029426CF6|nr:YopX family protein [Streptococcus orisratti]
MIPKFRVWDTIKKSMSEVQGIVYTEEKVYPIFNKVVRRYIPFSEAVLMQSTGGSDKYDEEIFEGDIIGEKDDASTYGVVTYDPDRLMFRVYGKDFDDALSDYWDCEIIGNIYENPELVEGDNE